MGKKREPRSMQVLFRRLRSSSDAGWILRSSLSFSILEVTPLRRFVIKTHLDFRVSVVVEDFLLRQTQSQSCERRSTDVLFLCESLMRFVERSIRLVTLAVSADLVLTFWTQVSNGLAPQDGDEPPFLTPPFAPICALSNGIADLGIFSVLLLPVFMFGPATAEREHFKMKLTTH